MAEVGVKELLEAGVHFGHQTQRWNPKMRRYLFGERGGIHIIDLQQTETLLAKAQEFAGAGRRARRDGPLRGHQEAGSRHGRRGRAAGRHALRAPALAGRPAHQLEHDLQAHRAPARAAQLDRERDDGPAADARAHRGDLRARQARDQPGRRGRHAAPARRDVRGRPQDGGHRRARGPAPEDPDHRPGRLQLRPGPRELRDPGQRRRDSLLQADHRGDRRRGGRAGQPLPLRGGGGAARARGGRPQGGRGARAPRGRGAGPQGGRGAGPCRGRRSRGRGRPGPAAAARRPSRSPSRQRRAAAGAPSIQTRRVRASWRTSQPRT